MKKTLLTILAGLMLASVSVLYTGCQSKPGTFEIGDGKFLLVFHMHLKYFEQ